MAHIKMIQPATESAGALTVKDLRDRLDKFISIGKGNLPVELDVGPGDPRATTVMLAGRAVRIDNIKR